MIMGLDLHQEMNRLLKIVILLMFWMAQEDLGERPRDDRRVVTVGRQNAVGSDLAGMTNHVKEGIRCSLPIHLPAGIEDLVPAMLGVGLGKHHEFNIGRVPS